MNITCDKNILIDNINIVLRAVSSKSTLPHTKCILLKIENNKLKLQATDLKLTIETSEIDAKIEENKSIAIDAKLFSEIIRKLPDGDIKIMSLENDSVEISNGKSLFKIQSENADEFPTMSEVNKDNYFKLKSNVLSEMINKTIFSVASDEIKPIFTGELFEIKDNNLNVVAIDGYRVAFIKSNLSDSTTKELNIVIPSKALLEISKIIDNTQDDITIFIGENNVLIESNKCKLVTKLLDGKFMEYEKIFAIDHITEFTIDKTEFINAIERSLLVSRDGKINSVKFEINKDLLTITSNTENGNSFDELKIDMNGEDLDIAFNPKYIQEILKNIDSEKVKLQFTNSLSPCIITGLTEKLSKYLVLPLRVKG